MATTHCTPCPVFVYALCEPDAPWNIRYVGATTRPLRVRLTAHIHERRKSRKCRWIASVLKQGKRPTIRLLDITDYDGWEQLERFYIAAFRQAGFALTNSTPGGDRHPPEMRAKMSARRLGKKRPFVPNYNRAKTHCAQGHPYTPENTRVSYGRDGIVHRACITCCNERNKNAARRQRGSLDRTPVPCACGCEELIVPFDQRNRPRRFAHGHNARRPDLPLPFSAP